MKDQMNMLGANALKGSSYENFFSGANNFHVSEGALLILLEEIDMMLRLRKEELENSSADLLGVFFGFGEATKKVLPLKIIFDIEKARKIKSKKLIKELELEPNKETGRGHSFHSIYGSSKGGSPSK